MLAMSSLVMRQNLTIKLSKFPEGPSVPGARMLPPCPDTGPSKSLVVALGFMACLALRSMICRYSAFSTGKQLISVWICPAREVCSSLHRHVHAGACVWVHLLGIAFRKLGCHRLVLSIFCKPGLERSLGV